MRIAVEKLQYRDHVDLQELGQFRFADGTAEAAAAQFEFGVVDSIEIETASCIVEFENFPSIGLPVGFMVEIDEDQADYVRNRPQGSPIR